MTKIQAIEQEISQLKEKLSECKGRPTEVYTRIVGYHRAVDNWNKGKREEYKNRVTFDFDSKKVDAKKINAVPNTVKEEELELSVLNSDSDLGISKYKLFTSQFCRNCTPVKEFIKNVSVVGEEIDVSTDLGINASREYNILSTPTVILFDEKGNILSRAYSVSDLKKCFAMAM